MTRPGPLSVLVFALLLVSPESSAQSPLPPPEEQRVTGGDGASSPEGPLGAVVAPATLPDGSTVLYGFVGAPELGVGFRQGIGGFELEARSRLQWLQLSAAFELAVRRKVFESGRLALAPVLGLGLVLNSGATYMDEDNFSGVLLRVSPGLVAEWRVAETVALVGLVDVPFDLELGSDRGRRLQALGGGGVELYLGDNVSLLAAGQLGLETFRERPGLGETRLGYAVRLGLGTRLF